MDCLTDELYLDDLKFEFTRTTGDRVDPKQERERLKAIALQEHLKIANILTRLLNAPGIKQLFFGDRTLCRWLTGNPNLASLLRIITCRWLTNSRQDCFLQYRSDIGYCFYHTAKDFAAETGISIHTIYKLIPKLQELGWIAIYHKQDVFGRVKWHIKLRIEAFIKRLITYAQSQLVDLTNCNLPNLPILSYINQIKKERNIEEDFSLKQDKKNTPAQANKAETNTKFRTRLGGFPAKREMSVRNQPSCDSFVDKSNPRAFSRGSVAGVTCGQALCPVELTEQEDRVPQVDEKVNKDKTLVLKAERMHRPEGDRYFQVRSQKSEVRSKAKSYSAVGMSGLRDVKHLEECRDRLTEYYLEIYDFETAEKKVNWEISQAKRGERSQLFREFLNGQPLGSKYKQEWEVKRGVLLPAFTAYLKHQLRKDKQTSEQVLKEVFWFKKDNDNLSKAWAECKRIIHIQKPKLKQAMQLGRDLNATDIPQWFIDAYRTEIDIKEIVDTAEVLSEIAIQQAEQTLLHQQRLEPSFAEIEELPPTHHIMQKIDSLGALRATQPSDNRKREVALRVCDPLSKLRKKREEVDSVMDRVAKDNKSSSSATDDKHVGIVEINSLLSDPILRPRGVMLANKLGLPLLLNDEGVAIAVDITTSGSESHGDAHKIYQPKEVEKGSKSAWEEAIAKSKFLRNRRNAVSE